MTLLLFWLVWYCGTRLPHGGGIRHEEIIPRLLSLGPKGVTNIPRSMTKTRHHKHTQETMEENHQMSQEMTSATSSALCLEACLHGRQHNGKDMIWWCLCATWFHTVCISAREEYLPGVWPCFTCREMPSKINSTEHMMSELLTSLKSLTKSVKT